MKKTWIFVGIAAVILGCSPRKNGFINRKYQGFTTYYNTLFNGKEALNYELDSRKESFQENFYDDFIPLLKAEDQPLGSDFGTTVFGESPNKNAQGTGSTTLEIAEAKAQKAIANHSMEFGGTERNKTIFDAYILLTQSRLYQGQYIKALDALNTLYSNMPNDRRLDLAEVYEARVFAQMKDFHRSEEIFDKLADKRKVKKSYRKLASLYYAEMLHASDREEDALDALEGAFKINKNRELRSRIAFLRGQILNKLDKPDEARASFITAYKYANDFEFEVKSQIEIAKTFQNGADDFDEIKNYLEKNSKKGIYGSRLNEFYYALGILALKANRPEEADAYFKKSLKEKISDPQIRGLAYYEIGKEFYNKNDYLAAGVYYDSAVAVMTYQPEIERLTEFSGNIKKLSANSYLIKKNDSILTLTKMSQPELDTYFGKYIAEIKAKDEKAAEEARKAAKDNKNVQFADFTLGAGVGAGGFSTADSKNSGKFYFANEATVAKGAADFKRLWGDRALADNWRYKGQAASIQDLKAEAMGMQAAPDPRRYEVSFYAEQIPTDAEEISALKIARDTAQLGMGTMYYEFFDNPKLATTTLYDLVDVQKPEEDTELRALYEIFYINYQQDPEKAARAKAILLEKYPFSPYAEFARNPKANSFTGASEEAEKAYTEAFDLYQEEKYEEAQKVLEEAIEKYKADGLLPKFYLLQAYNTGKLAGKEIMSLQLEQIALNYPKTEEGEKAQEILDFFKTGVAKSTKPEPTAQPQPATQPRRQNDARPPQNVNPRNPVRENPGGRPQRPSQGPPQPPPSSKSRYNL